MLIGLLKSIDNFKIALNVERQIKSKWGVSPFITHPNAIKASNFFIFFRIVIGISKIPGTSILDNATAMDDELANKLLEKIKEAIKNDDSFWADDQIIDILQNELKFNTYKNTENGIEQLGNNYPNFKDNNIILQYENGNHYNIYKKGDRFIFTDSEIIELKSNPTGNSGGKTFKNNKKRLRRKKKNETKKLNKK